MGFILKVMLCVGINEKLKERRLEALEIERIKIMARTKKRAQKEEQEKEHEERKEFSEEEIWQMRKRFNSLYDPEQKQLLGNETLESAVDALNTEFQLGSVTNVKIQAYIDGKKGPDIRDLQGLVDNHLEKTKRLQDGNMNEIESMLVGQATALQSLFVDYVGRMQSKQSLAIFEAYARIALKAQNQSRQTLAVLVELKNPKRTTFIKQQNNANNQQVNNAEEKIKKGKNSKKTNKLANELLLEESKDEAVDFKSQKKTSKANQPMEAVGKVNGAKN